MVVGTSPVIVTGGVAMTSAMVSDAEERKKGWLTLIIRIKLTQSLDKKQF